MKSYILLGFVYLIIGTDQKSTPEDTSYVAAVVEYEVNTDTDRNLQNYVRLIKEAANQDADVVVFPELTLSMDRARSVSIPIYGLLKEHPIPALHADLYNEILVTLSSAARENQIYVVVNLQEIMNCEDAPGEECPENKTYYFNTNAVFDREGAVIDRYRKINLFGEYSRTPALKPDLGVFSTDFGVRFGHFICFDQIFQVPGIQTPQKLNVTDIIFPTMWFSELPYLTAVQIQESYAYTMNVNFIVAGANNVRVGSAGSGIYSGKAGALISIMPGVPTTRLLVSRVPKVPGQVTEPYPGPIYDDPSEHDNLLIRGDPSIAAHTSRLLVPGYQNFILMSGDTICSFRINMTQTNNTKLKYRAFVHDGFNTYAKRVVRVASCSVIACANEDPKSCPYRAGVVNGVRTFSGVASGGIKSCCVYACTDDSVDTCGLRFPKYTPNSLATFQELSIDAFLTTPRRNQDLQADNIAYFPVSLQPSILPLESKDFSLNITSVFGIVDIYNYKLLNNNIELYSFGIFGRVFERDGDEPSPPWVEDQSTSSTPSPGTEQTDAPGSASSFRVTISMFIMILFTLTVIS